MEMQGIQRALAGANPWSRANDYLIMGSVRQRR